MTTLLPTPEIAIGRGRIAGLGQDVRSLVDRPTAVLVVIDPALAGSAVWPRLATALAAERLAPLKFDAFAGEPRAADIDRAATVARETRAEAVIGIGGGTALDVAKMVAAIASDDPGADHYQLCRHRFPRAPLPLIQVPTTAGTGSEATRTAVHTNAEGRKVWCWGPELEARRIVLDAELTASLPRSVAAATGLDALVHAVEAATNRNATPFTRLPALEAVRLVAAHLPSAVETGDPEARERMLWASCLAGIAINTCGTAIAHTIAHALGSLGRIPHGRAAAIGLLASLPWSMTHNREAYAEVAQAMGGARDAAELPELVGRLIHRVGAATTLGPEVAGLTPERLAAEMGRPEHEAMRRSTVRPSTESDLLELARAVLSL